MSFQVQLANEYRVQVHAFLVYDSPSLVEVSTGGSHAGSKDGDGGGETEEQYRWWVGPGYCLHGAVAAMWPCLLCIGKLC